MADKEKSKEGSFLERVSKDQAKDSGMALVLIFLILGLFLKQRQFYVIAAAALVLNMVIPSMYKPFAVFWFGLARLLGTVMPKIILTVIYILLVLPVGGIRRMLGKDALRLKKFKKDDSSVFTHRDHQFQPSDIENPY
ncbi:MAG: hypothetical protein GY940_04995 [bacterium]|nr:hypothetical protein [bacterium]